MKYHLAGLAALYPVRRAAGLGGLPLWEVGVRMIRLPALILAVSLLLGCAESKQEGQPAAEIAAQAAVEAVAQVEAQAVEVQAAGGEASAPVVLALRDAVDSIAVDPLPPPVQAIDPAVVALVVRWEVGSPAQYVRKYQGVICPGGASGPTIGIGDDLGHQTEREIRRRWGWHPDVERMVTASGQAGPAKCAAWRAAHRDIRVGYDDAIRVFTQFSWPAYQAMAERAYRNGWASLTRSHQGSLTSNGYNRGFTFLGSRRTEMRAIRDTCVPGSDAPCTAGQLRASCRVWAGTDIYKGLCARRYAEADFSLL